MPKCENFRHTQVFRSPSLKANKHENKEIESRWYFAPVAVELRHVFAILPRLN
jgi:hypothetical protein